MPVKGFAEVRLAGATTGIACTTAAARTLIPKGTDHLELVARNLSTAVVVRFGLLPYLVILKTADDLATVTDYSAQAQDGDTSTDVDLSSLGTLAQGDYVVVGSAFPFAGIAMDVDTANANASVMTVKYWNGSAWTDISATDGTASGGATLAQDGAVTWTIPAAWTKARLREIVPASAAAVGPQQHVPMFWLRIEVSAALDSTTKQNSWIAHERNTSYADLVSGGKFESPVNFGPSGIAGISSLTDAGTANLIANCYSEGGFTQA